MRPGTGLNDGPDKDIYSPARPEIKIPSPKLDSVGLNQAAQAKYVRRRGYQMANPERSTTGWFGIGIGAAAVATLGYVIYNRNRSKRNRETSAFSPSGTGERGPGEHVDDTSSAVTIAVGSKNPVKLRSGKLGMESVLSTEVHVEGFPAESGVPDQPVGDDETRRGAINRAKASWRMYCDAHGGAEPDFSIGMEGGINSKDKGDTMTCFAYIVIYDGTKFGKAKTATFDLPEAMARLVRGGMELGDADDQVMGRVNSKQGEGTVGALTRGLISRTDYYIPAVQLAYPVFNFPELYE